MLRKLYTYPEMFFPRMTKLDGDHWRLGPEYLWYIHAKWRRHIPLWPGHN